MPGSAFCGSQGSHSAQSARGWNRVMRTKHRCPPVEAQTWRPEVCLPLFSLLQSFLSFLLAVTAESLCCCSVLLCKPEPLSALPPSLASLPILHTPDCREPELQGPLAWPGLASSGRCSASAFSPQPSALSLTSSSGLVSVLQYRQSPSYMVYHHSVSTEEHGIWILSVNRFPKGPGSAMALNRSRRGCLCYSAASEQAAFPLPGPL